MNNEVILFATIISTGMMGMNFEFKPIQLQGKIEIAECPYYVAGYSSEEVLKETNTICCKEPVATGEQLSVPVSLLFQQKNGGYSERLPKAVGKRVQKVIDAMPVGPERRGLIKELVEIKSNCLPTMVLPIHRLQSNRNLTAQIGKLFVLSCIVDGEANEPILQDTMKQLKGKPAHIFGLNQSINSDTFDRDMSRQIFDLAAKGVINPSEELSDCLEEKDNILRNLLEQRHRMLQAGEDVTEITEQATDINMTTVFDFYQMEEYRPLCTLGDTKIYEVRHFLNTNTEDHVRTNGYLKDFSGKSSDNVFNIIQQRRMGRK